MKKNASLISLFLLAILTSFAQIPLERQNISELRSRNILKKETAPVIILSDYPLLNLIEEVKKESKNLPPRFGVALETSIGLDDGDWSFTKDSINVWSLTIHSSGAKSINVHFDKFQLSKEAKVFIYNEQSGFIQGPIESIKGDRFSSSQIKGDRITIELHDPTQKSDIHIDQVTHGYTGFGDAASCNNDINCSQGNSWQEESNSVSLIIVNGVRNCSGALISNTCSDFTPCFLTAFHCLDSNSDGVLSQSEKNAVADWSFRFQYKSPTCNGGDDNQFITYSGSEFIAGYSGSDFALLELNNDLVKDLSLAGWSRSNIAPSSGASITHPKGDVMKIGLFNQTPTQQT